MQALKRPTKENKEVTKKNLIALADDIRLHNVAAHRNQQYTRFTADQLDMLATYCASQNPRFKRERWLGYIAGENGPNGGAIRTK